MVLGRFPKESLMEIWKGKPIKKLRHHIKKHDFELGCGLCKDDILNGRFTQGSFGLCDHFPVKKMPSMLDFRLSNECNLKCVMCSGLSSSAFIDDSHDKSAIFGEDFLDQLSAFIPHLHTARFIGGEPFAIKIYYRIWEMIIDKNPQCNIVVQTNGTLLNDKIKELASRGKFHFSVSIDSFQKEQYEKIRVNASFEKVMSNIDFISKYCRENERNFILSFCPMRGNYHELRAFIDFANHHNALICINRFLFPANLAIWSLSSNEIMKIQSSLKKFSPASSEINEIKNRNFFVDYLDQLQEWINEANIRESSLPDEIEIEKLFTELRRAADFRNDLSEKMTALLNYPDQNVLYWFLKPVLHGYSMKLFLDFLEMTEIAFVFQDMGAINMK
jgi:sulfatase maturation enzyme AslB (radical SAM superfamily)